MKISKWSKGNKTRYYSTQFFCSKNEDGYEYKGWKFCTAKGKVLTLALNETKIFFDEMIEEIEKMEGKKLSIETKEIVCTDTRKEEMGIEYDVENNYL